MCPLQQVQIQSNSDEVTASLAGATLAPVFGYHKYYKFAAVVAGCVGTLGADCAPGFIDFFTTYFQEISDTALRSLSDALSASAATYTTTADVLSDFAGELKTCSNH